MSAIDVGIPLPEPMIDQGTLYLSPPVVSTRAKLIDFLGETAIKFSQPMPEILAVELVPGTLARLCTGLPDVLGDAELDDTNALIVGRDVCPSVSDLTRMRSLNGLLARLESEWLIDMLRESRFVTHFQPIIHRVPEGKIFGYESLVRGLQLDGTLVYPHRLFTTASASGVLPHLDRTARLLAIRDFAASKLDGHVFINFQPAAIYDPAFCLRSTVDAVAECGFVRERVVFEVVHSDQPVDLALLTGIVSFLRNAGFRIALDDFGNGYQSTNLLCKLKPDFIKLDMKLIRHVDKEPSRAMLAVELVDLAQLLGVATIAEGIETEGEWRWICDHGVDFAQGYLFGIPAPLAEGTGPAHAALAESADNA